MFTIVDTANCFLHLGQARCGFVGAEVFYLLYDCDGYIGVIR